MSRSIIWLLNLAVVGCALLLAGCAGYTLGPTNGLPAGERSVQIVPFMNQTLEPRLTDEVTQQMRKQLQRNGTFRLATHDDGDIVINGVINKYERHELSFSRNDTLTAKDYRIIITAQVTARERGTGNILLDQPVTGYTMIRVGSDIVSSERQGLPLLAADLARNITDLLADGKF